MSAMQIISEKTAARPSTERMEPALSSHGREAAYARWLDAVARVKTTA